MYRKQMLVVVTCFIFLSTAFIVTTQAFSLGNETFEICTKNRTYISNDPRDKTIVDNFSKLPSPDDIIAESDVDIEYAQEVANRKGLVTTGVGCSRPDMIWAAAALRVKYDLLQKKATHLNLWLIPPGRQTSVSNRPANGVDIVWDPLAARSSYLKAYSDLQRNPNFPVDAKCNSLFNNAYSQLSGDPWPQIMNALWNALPKGVKDEPVNTRGEALLSAAFISVEFVARSLLEPSATKESLNPFPCKTCEPFVSFCQSTSKTKSKFKVPSKTHSETENLEQVVKDECGSNYRIADWTDILAFRGRAEAFIKQVDMKVGEGEGKSFIITNNGQHFWNSQRHYFISRFDHNKRGNYLAHDNIDNHYISLGSWYGLKMQVLCIEK